MTNYKDYKTKSKIDETYRYEVNKHFISILISLVIIGILFILVIYHGSTNKININIVNRDGIAYIEYNNYISMLLDSNGNKIPYNERLSVEHQFETYGEKDRLIIIDTYTSMYYVLIEDNSNELPMINVMYNININNTIGEEDNSKKEIIITY